MNPYIMTVDLGRLGDFTAITILHEYEERIPDQDIHDVRLKNPAYRRNLLYRCRYLDRPALGTPYTNICAKISELIRDPVLAGQTDLLVDATGVGRPVVDLMMSIGLHPIPITIHGGNETTVDPASGFRVPKDDLASALRILWDTRRLKISKKLPLAEAVVTEASKFVAKIQKTANVTYEALREGDHDDLIMSLALGAWWVWKTRPNITKVDPLRDDKEETPYNPRDYLKRA